MQPLWPIGSCNTPENNRLEGKGRLSQHPGCRVQPTFKS
jgi:hypothetical protein